MSNPHDGMHGIVAGDDAGDAIVSLPSCKQIAFVIEKATHLAFCKMIQKPTGEIIIKPHELIVQDDLQETLFSEYMFDYKTLAQAVQVGHGEDTTFFFKFGGTLNNFNVPGKTDPALDT